MIKKISAIERMLILSIAFTMLLLTARILYIKELVYIFYLWNTFLAMLPFLFSRLLTKQTSFNYKAILLIASWLLFFPNAPYIITDIFHFEKRLPVPVWYDLTIVVSGAWNGLLLGIVSLMQVEQFLTNHFTKKMVSFFVFTSICLCGYGVYIGRFLRYNSWDVVTQPLLILFSFLHQVVHPLRNIGVWAFTFVFSLMLSIIYATLKQIPVWLNKK